MSCVKRLEPTNVQGCYLMSYYPKCRQLTKICYLTLHFLSKDQNILSISVWWQGSTTFEPQVFEDIVDSSVDIWQRDKYSMVLLRFLAVAWNERFHLFS